MSDLAKTVTDKRVGYGDLLGSVDRWDQGMACAEAGGNLADNPVPHEGVEWREWRRGFIRRFRQIHGRFP